MLPDLHHNTEKTQLIKFDFMTQQARFVETAVLPQLAIVFEAAGN